MKKYNSIIKYAIIFAVMCISSNAVFSGGIRPFGMSVYLGVLFSGVNILIVSPLFIAAELLAAPSFETLINCLGTTLVLMLFALYEKKASSKKENKITTAGKITSGWGADDFKKTEQFAIKPKGRNYYILVGAAALTGQIGYIYICLLTKFNIVNVVATCVLGTAFSYVCLVCATFCLKADKSAKLKYNEAACFSLLIIIMALGLAVISDKLIFDVSHAVLAFLVLTLMYSQGVKYSVTAAVLYGLGTAFATGDVAYAGVYGLIALACSLFKDSGKILALTAMVLTDVIIQLYFNFGITGFVFMPAFSILAGGALYIAIPKKYIKELTLFALKPESDGENDYLLLQKQTLQRDLRTMARSYKEIGMLLETNSIKPERFSLSHAKITKQLISRLCSDCKNHANCMITLKEQSEQAFSSLVDSSMNKGYASITAVPNYLGSRCSKIEELLKTLNVLIIQYNNEKAVAESKDDMRATLSAQISGVSKALEELSGKIGINMAVAPGIRTNILNELAYQPFESGSVQAYKDKSDKLTILVEVKLDIRPDSLIDFLSKITKQKLCLQNAGKSGREGWQLVEFSSSPVYDVAFGIHNANKANNKISGDTYSISKISADKVLIALCDGMGSGAQAEKVSNGTISLIESLYRAGFDSETILTLINKILIYKNDEIFCALDLAIIDLNTATVDFIKIGGTYGLVKSGRTIDVVGAGALPIGVLETVKPIVTSARLQSDDAILLFSDGVSDCFEGNKDFADFLFSVDTVNPAEAAVKIIDKCIEKDKFLPRDDMTVVCARIIKV